MHDKELSNCIINYSLLENCVEIQDQGNSYRYIINNNDMLLIDKENILKLIKGGFNLIENNFKINKIKIKGENICTLNETNRFIISNVLDELKPDFMLLNECNISKKAKFNMSDYNLIISNNQEVGIIYSNNISSKWLL